MDNVPVKAKSMPIGGNSDPISAATDHGLEHDTVSPASATACAMPQEHPGRMFAMSETLLPSIIEAIADGLFIADAHTRRILFANLPMCRLLGCDPKKITNRRFGEFLAPAGRLDGARHFEAMVTAQNLAPVELPLQRADGSVLSATLSGAPLSLNGRSLVVGIVHDVSSQHQAEVNLHESEQKLRTIFDSVSDGIIVHALTSGAFVEVNPRVCEMFGYTRDEMLKLDIEAMTAEPSAAQRARMIAHTERAASGEPHTFDWHVRAKDGRDFWVEVGLRRVTLGKEDYLLSTAHDITARKRSAEALAYRDRLLRATTLGTAALVVAERLEDGMSQALQIVGESLGVDRALVIVESGPKARPALRSVWEHPSIKVKLTSERFDASSIDPKSLEIWRAPLKAGEQVTVQRESASPAVRDLMASLENQSMLLVPIFVGDEYWGNIGLDSCRTRREWNTTDAEILHTFASVIGIAVLRNQTRRSLENSETQLSEALNMAQAGGWEYDVASDEFTFNDNFYRVLRTTARDVGGYRLSSAAFARRFVHPQDIAPFQRALRMTPNGAQPSPGGELEHRVIYGDGSSGNVLIRFFTIGDAAAPVRVHGVTQDITERKRSEQALRRANRALLTLSVGSETLVRSRQESEFLARMCDILVDIGEYATALIGFAEHDRRKTVRLAAIGGLHRELFERTRLTWEDVESGQGPIGVAIRSGKPEINRDFQTNPKVTLWRNIARELSYASSIALPLRDHSEVLGVLAIYSKDPDAFNPEEVQLLTEFGNDLSFGIVSLRSQAAREEALARLRGAMISTVQALATTLERRDPYTAGHQRAVAKLATAIASRIGVSPGDLDGVNLAATIHDIGKIQVPTEILSKPGKLTPLEFQIVQTHAEAGYEIVKGVDFPWPIAQMILQHHERLDGSGYPRGLKGAEILLGARIIAVADVVESMMAHRPYRPALGLAPALAEIERGKGTLYDESVVEACVALLREENFKF